MGKNRELASHVNKSLVVGGFVSLTFCKTTPFWSTPCLQISLAEFYGILVYYCLDYLYILKRKESSGRRKRVRLDGKVGTSVDVVSGVAKGSVLRPLLFIWYTSKFFRTVGKHIVGYADNTKI